MMQGEANTVHHVPCRLLGNPEIASNFIAADAVLAGNKQPHSRKPLFKGDSAVLEDSAGLQGEGGARMLRVALPYAGFLKVGDLLRAATRTFYNAIRPTKLYHEVL